MRGAGKALYLLSGELQRPRFPQDLLKPPDSTFTSNTPTSVKGFPTVSEELKAGFSPFLFTSFLVLETIICAPPKFLPGHRLLVCGILSHASGGDVAPHSVTIEFTLILGARARRKGRGGCLQEPPSLEILLLTSPYFSLTTYLPLPTSLLS